MQARKAADPALAALLAIAATIGGYYLLPSYAEDSSAEAATSDPTLKPAVPKTSDSRGKTSATDKPPSASPPVSPAAGAPKTADSTAAKQDEVLPQSDQVKGPKGGLAIDVTVVGIDGKPAEQCQAITIWEKVKAASEIGPGDYVSTDPRDGAIWRRVWGSVGGQSCHYFAGNTRPLPPGVYHVTAFVGARAEKMVGWERRACC